MEQLTIPKTSIVYRLYAWSLGLQEEFKMSRLDGDYLNRGTNLCHLVRSIVIYIPMLLIAQVLAYASPIAAVFVVPYFMFGSVKGPALVAGILLAGSLVWILIVVIDRAMRDHGPISRSRYASCRPGPVRRVVSAYVQTIHKGICPLISWGDK